jgi:hypothetical protein
MDPEKLKSRIEWPTPRFTFYVRRFHGLASFYLKFIRNFSQICAPLIECMKKGVFQWIVVVEKSFKELNKRVTTQPVFPLQYFNQVF